MHTPVGRREFLAGLGTAALAAGCRAAFVARPGATLYPRGPQPDVIGPDLTAVAAALLSGGA